LHYIAWRAHGNFFWIDIGDKGMSFFSHLKNKSTKYGYWQTWVGLTASGVCSALGLHVGLLMGYRTLGAVIGGALGGYIFSQASNYAKRLHRDGER
jgi:hypothetical protein